MNGTEIAAALCEIPTYLNEHPDISLEVRLREILSSRAGPVKEADLVSILSAHRELIDSWAAYIEDQRTTDGWYVAVSTKSKGPTEWILKRLGRKDLLTFDSQIAAYAALILRIAAPAVLSSQGHR
jgi:hypothetical protein